MIKSNQQTITYNCRDGFKVDIVTRDPNESKNSIGIVNPLYEAYLYHDGYGIKTMIYGTLRESLDDFVNTIEALLEEEIEAYQYEYMD